MRLLSTRLLFSSLFFSQIAYAVSPIGSVLNLYAGIDHTMNHPNALFFNTLYPQKDTLTKNSKSGYGFTGGIGFAYDFLIGKAENNHQLANDIAIGLDLFLLNTTIKGDVLQFGSPTLNNFAYQFDLKTTRLMLDGQLNFHPIKNITPFLIGGLGAASVHSKYMDTPTKNTSGGVNLPSSIHYNMACTLGAGLKLPLSKKIQLSLSYLYTDLGHAQTGASSLTSPLGNIEPITMRLQTQTGLLGITYAFG